MAAATGASIQARETRVLLGAAAAVVPAPMPMASDNAATIWPVLAKHLNQLPAVRRFPHYAHPSFGTDDCGKPLADDRMIVGDHHADLLGTCHLPLSSRGRDCNRL